MNIGQRIKDKRKAAKMTQEELGQKLGISGAAIAQYETGKRNPKIETIKKIAAALNCTAGYLQDGKQRIGDMITPWISDKAARLELCIDTKLLSNIELMAQEDARSLADEVETILKDAWDARIEAWMDNHPDG